VLAVDTVVALHCAGLRVPDKRTERDAMIAATALVHGPTVVTRDVADFEATGVALVNPWQSQQAPKFPEEKRRGRRRARPIL
jgi:toxin FitB